MGKVTPGRRIATPPTGWNDTDYPDNPDGMPWRPGDFWKNVRGEWEACTPNGAHAGLRLHTVIEHDDGTITVSPSIECNAPQHGPTGGPYWHGFLEAGVWREC